MKTKQYKKYDRFDTFYYFFLHILWMACICVIYSCFVFLRIRRHTPGESTLIFLALLLACSLAGILVDFKARRNEFSAFRNVVWGPGLYTIWAYWPLYSTSIVVVMAVFAFLALLYSSLVLFRRIRNKQRRTRIVKRRVVKAITDSGTILCAGMLCLMLVVAGNKLQGKSLLKSSDTETPQAASIEEYLAEYRDIDVLAQPDVWDRLPLGGKLWVLQTVSDLELGFLGVPNKIEVYVDELESGISACYNENEQSITLSYNTLDRKPSACLRSLLHEVYHCYQHRLVEAYNAAVESLKNLQIYDAARIYKREFATYKGINDLEAYAKQQVEIDANAFSKEAAERYLEWINTYLIGS